MTPFRRWGAARRTVEPATLPVALADVQFDTREESSEADDRLTFLIGAATAMIEDETGRALITQTWQIDLSGVAGREHILLCTAPVQSISAVQYYDAAGDLQSLDAADFRLFDTMDRPVVMPVEGVDWPALQDRPDALKITFVAGYGAASAVPQRLREAIRLLTVSGYDNPAAVADKALTVRPFGVPEAIAAYRLGWFAA